MGTPAPTSVSPASHWYTSVFHFFKHVNTYVSEAFVKLFGSDAAHSFAVGAESLLKSDLGKIAMIAVQEAANLATGAEKQTTALGKIMTEATKMGLDVKTSLANLLIELAVSRLKGVFGNPTP
jgi:hypothetical protein